MAQVLGLIILSFFITGILLVPFIDFLYKIKLQRQVQKTKDMFEKRTPLFDKHHAWKVGTPFGGGVLIIVVVSILTLWAYGMFGILIKPWELFVLLFSFIGFGLLGLYDDVKKLVNGKKASVLGLRFRHKFLIQWFLAFIIAAVMYTQLGYSFIFIHGFGLATIGILYVFFAAFVIVSFTNAFNIADGLDGLASGLLLICLGAFLAIASSQLDDALGVFIAVLMGSVMAFLYFNIYRARLWLGDVGSMSLGAALAVIGLLTGKTLALAVIGGVFVIEVGSSLIQILGKNFLGKKIFHAAPFHLYLQERGWEEPKIVMRAWLLGFLFAIIGLYLAFIKVG
ncbi:MAG: phospho-N-acetylmuramoyl-pentapeptide-transferase [Candidatus Levyibacteriota bacterium]|nr:MAG: phospho-N-acetylmuramoyl-pentapeptide-transferase [Candidatus Levybacteria bacterium]